MGQAPDEQGHNWMLDLTSLGQHQGPAGSCYEELLLTAGGYDLDHLGWLSPAGHQLGLSDAQWHVVMLK